jgi:phosphoserine phosphatase
MGERQIHRQAGLAACRRACDKHDRFVVDAHIHRALMDNVIVLIASPEGPGLEAISKKIKSGVQAKDFRWLAHSEALEFRIDARLDPQLYQEIEARSIDIAVVPAEPRRKRLLVADMDSTMIAQECIDELASLAGVKEDVAAITLKAMKGELDFDASLRRRLALVAGLDRQVVDDLLAAIRYTPGGRTLVQTMKAHGAYTALVSGGFTAFSNRVAANLGFDEHRANELVIEQDKLAGRAREPILGRNAKVSTLKDLTARLGLRRDETLAVGDGANDIDMLEAAGLGVAFHAKPILRERADVRIDHTDLTSLLYVQGYRKDEFVT